MKTTAVFFALLVSGAAYGADCREKAYPEIRNAEGEYEKGDYAAAERLFRSGSRPFQTEPERKSSKVYPKN
jgi:hypothetical protein